MYRPTNRLQQQLVARPSNPSIPLDQYKELKVLGKGSFGKAVLCEHIPTHTKYVMKVIQINNLKPKEREDAVQEAKILSVLKHPYITGYKESFNDSKHLYIVMEYADRGDLYEMIKRQKQRGHLFPESQIWDWFVQICLALKHAHDRHILHRDLKCQNIFLCTSPINPQQTIIKLGDFGVARLLQSTMECARTAIGTPYYLSPELCEDKPYNNRSDVWALGCVLYEMCTLQHAFDAANIKMLVVKILRGQYSAVSSQYSELLRTLVYKMLQKRPDARPSVNTILKLPFLQDRIRKFLPDAVFSDEFSHTMLHKNGNLKPMVPIEVLEAARDASTHNSNNENSNGDDRSRSNDSRNTSISSNSGSTAPTSVVPTVSASVVPLVPPSVQSTNQLQQNNPNLKAPAAVKGPAALAAQAIKQHQLQIGYGKYIPPNLNGPNQSEIIRADRERIEQNQREKERLALIAEKERLERLALEKEKKMAAEKKRAQQESEYLERLRKERELFLAQQREKEKLAQIEREKENRRMLEREKERLEQERKEKERMEKEYLEKLEKERIEREKEKEAAKQRQLLEIQKQKMASRVNNNVSSNNNNNNNKPVSNKNDFADSSVTSMQNYLPKYGNDNSSLQNAPNMNIKRVQNKSPQQTSQNKKPSIIDDTLMRKFSDLASDVAQNANINIPIDTFKNGGNVPIAKATLEDYNSEPTFAQFDLPAMPNGGAKPNYNKYQQLLNNQQNPKVTKQVKPQQPVKSTNRGGGGRVAPPSYHEQALLSKEQELQEKYAKAQELRAESDRRIREAKEKQKAGWEKKNKEYDEMLAKKRAELEKEQQRRLSAPGQPFGAANKRTPTPERRYTTDDKAISAKKEALAQQRAELQKFIAEKREQIKHKTLESDSDILYFTTNNKVTRTEDVEEERPVNTKLTIAKEAEPDNVPHVTLDLDVEDEEIKMPDNHSNESINNDKQESNKNISISDNKEEKDQKDCDEKLDILDVKKTLQFDATSTATDVILSDMDENNKKENDTFNDDNGKDNNENGNQTLPGAQDLDILNNEDSEDNNDFEDVKYEDQEEDNDEENNNNGDNSVNDLSQTKIRNIKKMSTLLTSKNEHESLCIRMDSLRTYLENELGFDKFLAAYEYISNSDNRDDSLQEDDEAIGQNEMVLEINSETDKVVPKEKNHKSQNEELTEILGKGNEGYINLIINLIFCEDRFNSGEI